VDDCQFGYITKLEKKSPGSDHYFFCDEISHCGNKKNPVRRAQRIFLRKKNTKSSHILKKKSLKLSVIRQCDLRGSQKLRRIPKKFYFLIWPLAKFVSFLLSMIAIVHLPHKIGKKTPWFWSIPMEYPIHEFQILMIRPTTYIRIFNIYVGNNNNVDLINCQHLWLHIVKDVMVVFRDDFSIHPSIRPIIHPWMALCLDHYTRKMS
jgi:hypothetical protein